HRVADGADDVVPAQEEKHAQERADEPRVLALADVPYATEPGGHHALRRLRGTGTSATAPARRTERRTNVPSGPRMRWMASPKPSAVTAVPSMATTMSPALRPTSAAPPPGITWRMTSTSFCASSVAPMPTSSTLGSSPGAVAPRSLGSGPTVLPAAT